MFARKRETEQIRNEKNSAVANYYDNWGRITGRFENWSTPEYYEKSEQMLRKEEEEKRRKRELEEQREKMRDLLAKEKAAWEQELKEQQRNKIRPGSSKSTNGRHDVDVLQRLNTTLSDQERRRKEIEAKLYSRWRLGMTRDDLILESKNHHQAMAKLNWLDQQVEEQLERDRSAKEFEVLQMKRQSEQLREEEIALETRQSRERAMTDLKKMLDYHILELSTRESDSKGLKDTNAILYDVKSNLQIKHQEVLDIYEGRRNASISMHNLRRLKVLVLNHCQRIIEEIAEDAVQLNAIRGSLGGQLISATEEKHFQLLGCKFDQEILDIKADIDNFTAMYDSEVKSMLIKQQNIWRENAETRFRLLNNLIKELKEKCDILITCNCEEIGSLIKIKESHLKAIDDLNEKLQPLARSSRVSYVEDNLVKDHVVATSRPSIVKPVQSEFVSIGQQMEHLTAPKVSSDRTEDGSPRFGRKKFAWY